MNQNYNGHSSIHFEDSVEINFDSITQEHTVVTATCQVGGESCWVHSVVMIGSQGSTNDRVEWSRRRSDRCPRRRRRQQRPEQQGQYSRSTAAVLPSSSVTRTGREPWSNGVTSASAEERDCFETTTIHPVKRHASVGATVSRLFQNKCFYMM